MRIADVLRNKGAAVVTINPDATVGELLAGLAEQNIGAMVVVGAEGVVGIVSERDVVRQLHTYGASVLSRPVAKIMSTTVATCTKSDTVDKISVLMTENRVRHVPVLDGKKLIGIVSIGDVVKSRMGELEAEQQQLQSYITQADCPAPQRAAGRPASSPGGADWGLIGARCPADCAGRPARFSARRSRHAAGRLPRRRLAFQNRAFAADTLLGYVEHPVQPYPAFSALVVPSARTDSHPVPVGSMALLAGHQQPQQNAAVSAHDEHGSVFAAGGVLLVGHPSPHDLAGIGPAIEVRGVDKSAGSRCGGTAGAGHRPARGNFGRWRRHGGGHDVRGDLDGLPDCAKRFLRVLQVTHQLRSLSEHQVLREALQRFPL